MDSAIASREVLPGLRFTIGFQNEIDRRLASIPPDVAGSYAAAMKRAGSAEQLFDVLGKLWRFGLEDASFATLPSAPGDPRLTILTTPWSIRVEAVEVRNCLKTHRFFPNSGDIAYAAWRGEERASVRLVLEKASGDWRLSDVRGIKNADVSVGTRREVLAASKGLKTVGDPLRCPYRAWEVMADTVSGSAEVVKLAPWKAFYEALQSIRGKTEPGSPAWAAVGSDQGYVRVFSDQWGEVFTCVISSHRIPVPVRLVLSEEFFRLVTSCGFKWPDRLAQRFEPNYVLIEDAGAGTSVAAALKDGTGVQALPIKPQGNKEQRVFHVSGVLENYTRVPHNAPWLEEFLDELVAFPKMRHDDQVDALTQLLAWGELRRRMHDDIKLGMPISVGGGPRDHGEQAPHLSSIGHQQTFVGGLPGFPRSHALDDRIG